MVSTVVVLIFFVFVLYAYKNHNHELEATASAIRQIWSGSCRLSCRQSENSGFSSLSGLDKGQAQVTESNDCKTNAGQGTCVCETCPCALVDNVLRTCRPATNLYNHSIELISTGYYNVVKAICEAGRMGGGGMSDIGSGKSNLFTIKQVGSADNINFINQVAVKAEVDINGPESSQKNQAESSKRKEFNFLPKKVTSAIKNRLDFGQRKEIVFKNESNATLKDLSKTEIVSLKESLNEPDQRGSETSVRMVTERKSCSKCIEKGMVCMGTCPRNEAVNEMWSGIFHCPNDPVGGLPPSNIPSLRQAPAETSGCPLKCMIKAGVFMLLMIFVLYLPLGDPYTHCLEPYRMYGKQLAMCSICDLYLMSTEVAYKSLEVSGEIYKKVSKLLYESKLKFYSLLDTIDRDDLCRAICCSDRTTSLDLGTKKERRACKCMKKCRLKSAN